mmetsp:Transcript_43504/g.114788  ORF Transcript_43504/g.114788 Transcript_43504/m.114788 type:complete len:162 (+) Transcript_43504:608-1093(+)
METSRLRRVHKDPHICKIQTADDSPSGSPGSSIVGGMHSHSLAPLIRVRALTLVQPPGQTASNSECLISSAGGELSPGFGGAVSSPGPTSGVASAVEATQKLAGGKGGSPERLWRKCLQGSSMTAPNEQLRVQNAKTASYERMPHQRTTGAPHMELGPPAP